MISAKDALNLIRRARNGDQNAMGLIAATRESALRPEGSEARKSMQVIFAVLKKNPVSDKEAAFSEDDNAAGITQEAATHLGILKWAARGGDGDPRAESWCLRLIAQSLLAAFESCPSCMPVALVILVQGAPLSLQRMSGLVQQCPPGIQSALTQSLTDGGASAADPSLQSHPAIQAGHALSQARAIQLQKYPGQPLSQVSVSMGCEMGEADPGSTSVFGC